ncbi:metallophosphoesterase [Cupriavidus sp. Agwp_2]|uniref:metallophosphoesterase n=1 Tax=Cupriavidus sp. Agwp_2 TaxID=2897324 RepID=UPI00346120F1
MAGTFVVLHNLAQNNVASPYSLAMTLRFIHLSDIHFGQEKDSSLFIQEDVREELLNDCRRMLDEETVAGPPTAILITGDLVQSGKEEEFKTAGAWLERLTNIVGCGRQDVRVIPGNHDIDLQALDATGLLTQSHLRTQPVDMVETYLHKAAVQSTNPLVAKFADYRSFAGAYGSDFKGFREPYNVATYKLDGGKAIRVIGLCSVMISDRNDKPGTMFLGRSQYSINRDSNCEDIVMIHHPLEWLMDRREAEPYLHGRPRMILSGHEHKPDLTLVHRETDWQQVLVAAGATNPPRQDLYHQYTYNWIELSWNNSNGRAKLNVTVYPRVWSPKRTGFDADYVRLSGKAFKTLVVDCGVASEQPAQPLERSEDAITSSPERGKCDASDLQMQAQVLAVKSISVDSEAKMTDTNGVPPEAGNIGAFETLRFLFWRYLDRSTRHSVLAELELMPKGNTNLPSAFEREAFEEAARRNLLAKLWDATMVHVPDTERSANPF